MQILQSIHAGDLLEIRRYRWLVLDVRAYERCQLLTVAGAGPGNAGTYRQFLVPIEVIAPLNRPRAPRVVRPRRWRHACRELLADCTPALARKKRVPISIANLGANSSILAGLRSPCRRRKAARVSA